MSIIVLFERENEKNQNFGITRPKKTQEEEKKSTRSPREVVKTKA